MNNKKCKSDLTKVLFSYEKDKFQKDNYQYEFSFVYCLQRKSSACGINNIKILQINVSLKTIAYVNKQ